MAGSKSEATLVLLYNNEMDKAFWAIKSAAIRTELSSPHWEVVWEDAANYKAVSELAGPKPTILIEEVQSKQGDNHEQT